MSKQYKPAGSQNHIADP